jgi:hypothetical protein
MMVVDAKDENANLYGRGGILPPVYYFCAHSVGAASCRPSIIFFAARISRMLRRPYVSRAASSDGLRAAECRPYVVNSFSQHNSRGCRAE